VSGLWDPHGRSGPSGGTRMSGRTDGWDSFVRSDRRVGPMCKVSMKKFKCMTGGSHMASRWDPHGRLGPMGGTRMAGRARRVGPVCPDGLTGRTRAPGWTKEIQVYGRWALHSHT
jgi:hypothetical protein